MTCVLLPSSKVLFLVALSLAPNGAHTIYASSPSKHYLWTQTSRGWSLETQRLPTEDWHDLGSQSTPSRSEDMRAIEEHHWGKNSFLYLEDGNRIDQQGPNVFYTIEPGEANAETFTILYPKS